VAPYDLQASILVIDAPTGTKISQATPRSRAAAAIAWAWLPALPAVTPARARSPSTASLLMAPRILNEPVRCRFSAFTTTRPPVAADSTGDESTGVRTTVAATASRARRIAS
jgi:hypothetical protein